MPNLRSIALVFVTSLVAAPGFATEKASPKYYFKVSNIHTQDRKIIPLAKELLEKEVASRPEFTMDLDDASSEAAEIAEMQRRGMKGFQVSMRINSLKTAIKPPKPGNRDEQMSIEVKLAVFGHTIPGNKIMFTGDGDATLTGEFSARLRDQEEARFTRTALESAIKQAVTTAVAKLTTAKLEDRGPPRKAKKRKAKP